MKMIENLREFQMDKSLTSVELANLLSVDLDRLTKWYEGEESPDREERYRIIKLFDGGDIDDKVDTDNPNTRFLND